MISLNKVVEIIVYLLVAGCVFALLMWLINYIGTQFPESGLFIRIARIVLVVLAVLFLIGLLLRFGGFIQGPIFV